MYEKIQPLTQYGSNIHVHISVCKPDINQLDQSEFNVYIYTNICYKIQNISRYIKTNNYRDR